MIPLGKAGSSHDTVTESFPAPVKLGVPTGPGAGGGGAALKCIAGID